MNNSHKLYTYYFLILFVCLIAYGKNQASAPEIPDEYKLAAAKVLPTKPQSFQELWSIFEPVLLPPTKEKFTAYFSILYRPDFPQPRHLDPAIVKGFQCLYSKMAYANILAEAAEKNAFQLTALYQLLGFHKQSIARFDPSLADEIPGFTCSSCSDAAKKSLGILEHQGY